MPHCTESVLGTLCSALGHTASAAPASPRSWFRFRLKVFQAPVDRSKSECADESFLSSFTLVWKREQTVVKQACVKLNCTAAPGLQGADTRSSVLLLYHYYCLFPKSSDRSSYHARIL